MFKNKSKKFFTVILTTLSLATITTATTNIINPQTTTTAKAKTDGMNALNNIWMTTNDNRYQVEQIDQNNNIYYSITTPKSNLYYFSWQLAAQQWNKLGVIHLVQVPVGDSRSQISLGGTYHYMPTKKLNKYLKAHHLSTENDGVTNSSYENASVDGHPDAAYLTDVSAQLLPASWNESALTLLKIAEHELGHCLGFGHDAAKINGRKLTMNAYTDGNSAPLGNTERQLLLKYYGPFLNQNNKVNSSNSGEATSNTNTN